MKDRIHKLRTFSTAKIRCGMNRFWIVGLINLVLAVSDALAQKPGPTKGMKAGLTGEYFNGPNFEQKVLTRTDPQVNFDWNWQSPGPGVQREYFSVRWTGKLYAPISGKYRFSATVDDGVRVWVGGKKVIDEWRKQDDSQFVGEILLTGNRFYDLRVEYYNDWKGSVISVFWESPEEQRLIGYKSTPSQLIPEKYLFSGPVRSRAAESTLANRLTRSPAVARRGSVTGRMSLLPAATAGPVAKSGTPKPALKSASTLAKGTESVVEKEPIPKPIPTVGGVARVEPEAGTPGLKVSVGESFTTLKAGETVLLRWVVFDQSEYTLLPESYPELNKLVEALRANPVLRVEIAGHTDNVGDQRLNQALSENRAKVVGNYLIQHGIRATRITTVGYGGSLPIVGNTNEEQRAKNRRVELIVNE